MKKIIYILFVLFTFTGFSQTKTKKIQYGKSYTTLKTYKKLYGNEFSKEDSLSFKFHGNDTLVPLPEDYKRPEGIRVEYQPKNGVFLEIYKDIVYRKYLDKAKEDSKKLTMRYWKNTLKIYFTKSVDKTIKNELKNFAKFLSTEVDSLNITFVNSLEKSNYIIYEINSKNNYKYDNRIKEGKNSYYITWDTNQRIYDCKLQINELPFEKKEDFILNTKKLFLETLGHFNYTTLLPKENFLSSLNYKDKKFSEKDLEILKYHYSYGICKGTELADFEEQHKKAINTFETTGRNMYFIHKN